jgi:hypothetical protein
LEKFISIATVRYPEETREDLIDASKKCNT